MKRRGERIPATLVDENVRDAELVDPSVTVEPINPFEPPQNDTESSVLRREERYAAAKQLADQFLEVNGNKTNSDLLMRDYFFVNYIDHGSLASATELDREEAYKHFQDIVGTLGVFDY